MPPQTGPLAAPSQKKGAASGARKRKTGVEEEDVVIAILLTACLIGEPTTCRDDKITLLPGVSLTRCLMTAPPHLAKWSEEHPGWHVERWQCGNASRQDI
jgi:hypothetical protein